MKKKIRKVFETDRKMELRVRLAAKKAQRMTQRALVQDRRLVQKYATVSPDPEVVTRIIKRVRKL